MKCVGKIALTWRLCPADNAVFTKTKLSVLCSRVRYSTQCLCIAFTISACSWRVHSYWMIHSHLCSTCHVAKCLTKNMIRSVCMIGTSMQIRNNITTTWTINTNSDLIRFTKYFFKWIPAAIKSIINSQGDNWDIRLFTVYSINGKLIANGK